MTQPPDGATPGRDTPAITAATLLEEAAAWDAFVACAWAPSYMQATPWADVKAATGWQAARVAAEADTGPIAAQVLIRRRKPLPKGMGYAPRGPIAAGPLDAASIEAFTSAARAAGRRLNLSHIRIDPELEDPDGSIAAGLAQAGWQRAPDINPPTTRIIDIGQAEEEVWAGIHRKWRQSITKAARGGVRVVAGDATRIGEFHAIHVRSMERAGLPFRTEAVYRRLWNAFAPAGHADLLFVEDEDGSTTATILLVGWGGRIADLYGGQTDEGARTRANYLIKWEAIKRARAAGYQAYDLWGLPSEPVAAFKAGWGGREVRYVGAWDLVLDPLARRLFDTAVGIRGRMVRSRYRSSHADGRPAEGG